MMLGHEEMNKERAFQRNLIMRLPWFWSCPWSETELVNRELEAYIKKESSRPDDQKTLINLLGEDNFLIDEEKVIRYRDGLEVGVLERWVNCSLKKKLLYLDTCAKNQSRRLEALTRYKNYLRYKGTVDEYMWRLYVRDDGTATYL